MNINVPLQANDSVLVCRFNSNREERLFEFNSLVPREAASLSKIFLALEVIERISKKELPNKVFSISKKDTAGYGTDVLSDLVSAKNKVNLDTLTLVGLMIKYSCNSSAAVLANKLLPPRSDLQKRAFNYWRLKNVSLVNSKGDLENLFSLDDIYRAYKKIFYQKGPLWGLLKEKMRTSRNIYYLFDQLKVKILASKSGTAYKGGYYWISDSGVIEINGQKYFLGANICRKKISTAVKKIRGIGKKIVVQI